MMKRLLITLCVALMALGQSVARERVVRLKWVHTSDVHGSLFAYDYLRQQPTKGGLSAIYAYADSLRAEWGDRLILTDGGDVLQGQPTAYYYNYVDTVSPHLVASAMNKMGYVAGAWGNHDVEAGHAVYDRWLAQLNFPMLGANVIDTRTGEPYLPPYTIVERAGVKIAILGMITPGIPNWLPETLWSGLRFEDMLKTAQHWVPIIQERERPDLLFGLFHSGLRGGIVTDEYTENATEQIAREVPGFQAIFYGHDHQPQAGYVQCKDGHDVLTLGPTNAGRKVAVLDIELTKRKGKVVDCKLVATIEDVTQGQSPTAQAFEREFAAERAALEAWIAQPIGSFVQPIREREAFFGSNAFVDLIHQMQLDLSGADISFAAPLSFDSRIDSGAVTVRDMFALYKYENFLYTMRLRGQEIKDYLEYSYAHWTNQMQSADDHLLLLSDGGLQRRRGLQQLYYNMDSAAGIDYTVDVTQPAGQRIAISGLSDGRPFEPEAWYAVALNSYRGNGGGGLLTEGAGISHGELPQRIVNSTEKDLRYYMMQRIQAQGEIVPRALGNWRFVPEEWTVPAAKRDSTWLFGR